MLRLVLLTLRTYLIGVLMLGACLFLPAWTLSYWQAWLFIAVVMTSTNAIGLYLWFKDPALLERRKRVGPAAEQEGAQKVIASLLMVACVALLALCGFDRRFGWSRMPAFVSVLGNALVVLGLLVTWLVLRVNSYAASTIETTPGQTVISTGPYAVVRHPMYSGTLVLLLGIPLALGSWWGLLLIPFLMPIMVWRIRNEEQVLERRLLGYVEYETMVRYRLIPHVW